MQTTKPASSIDEFLEKDIDVGPSKKKEDKKEEVKAPEDHMDTIVQQLESIIVSLDSIDTEKELISDIKRQLNSSYGLKPKTVSTVVKIMRNPDYLNEMEDHQMAVDALMNKVRNAKKK